MYFNVHEGICIDGLVFIVTRGCRHIKINNYEDVLKVLNRIDKEFKLVLVTKKVSFVSTYIHTVCVHPITFIHTLIHYFFFHKYESKKNETKISFILFQFLFNLWTNNGTFYENIVTFGFK